MTYTVTMRDNATGETKSIPKDLPWFDHSLFFWSRKEGNFGCDCNRRDVFYPELAEGEDDEENEESAPCGYERFSVLSATLGDGRVVQIDPLT